jgi:protocatechuate 3,4-dioxygenase beta subunit
MTHSAGARSDPVSIRSQIRAIPQEAHSLRPDDCAMHDDATHHEHHDDGDGLHEDLVKLATRRDALRIFGAGSAAAILATLGASTAARAATPTGEVPNETAGPYPGDGSNGPDVLEDSGIVRHDIRRSFGSSRRLAKGVPLRVNLTVTEASNDYAPLSGLAVYLWHCDRSGRYSMYSSGIEDENYLRGIAKTESDGTAWFRTIFPACYSGRWPHIHFEVYSSVAKAVSNGPIVKTSQIALPRAACKKVYATRGYSGSSSNLTRTSLSTDNVFSDDRAIHQLATVTGSVKHGFVANLTIGV